jgi:ABC-type Fe3+-hydroxamate transport system substrate-binding protein
MTTVSDDLGSSMELRPESSRVVSLVPSITESIAFTRPSALVAATDWCTRPIGLDVARIRGTKNPNVREIIELQPDLVIANQEENREIDVRRLRASGVPVWVTVSENVSGALDALARLFVVALRWPEPDWLLLCRQIWSVPAPEPWLRVAVPIWRDPWMVVGARTFAGDLLARLGLVNVFSGPDRYPHVTPQAIIDADPDIVLLPDEPYVFTADDGPEALGKMRCALVEGRALTWYGPSLLTARDVILDQIAGSGR